MTSAASDFRRIGVAVPVASRCLPLRQEGYELENHETNPSVCTRSCMFAQPVLVNTPVGRASRSACQWPQLFWRDIGFTVNGQPSDDARYADGGRGGIGPGVLSYVQGPSLECCRHSQAFFCSSLSSSSVWSRSRHYWISFARVCRRALQNVFFARNISSEHNESSWFQ